MRKFNQVTETEDILDELLEGIELAEEKAAEEEQQEEKKSKKEKKKKTKGQKAQSTSEEEPKKEEEADTFNPNGLPMVLERIEAGLIGSLKITDTINSPIFKPDDIAQLRKPNRLLAKDFVLYKIQDDYFLRRIIKFKENDIYVAGDNEKEYHIIHKENVVAKAVARERGKTFLSLGFNPKKKFYTFTKVKLAPLRLGNRVTSYEEDQNAEAFEAAMALAEQQASQLEAVKETPQYNMSDVDLDSDLAAFLDPDELVREFRGEGQIPVKEEEEEEEIVYVDEFGNEISAEEYQKQQEEAEAQETDDDEDESDSEETTEDDDNNE